MDRILICHRSAFCSVGYCKWLRWVAFQMKYHQMWKPKNQLCPDFLFPSTDVFLEAGGLNRKTSAFSDVWVSLHARRAYHLWSTKTAILFWHIFSFIIGPAGEAEAVYTDVFFLVIVVFHKIVVSQTFIAALFWYHRDQFLKLVCFFPPSPHQENTTRDNKQFSTRVFSAVGCLCFQFQTDLA